jgi:sulfatase maturation enzyme AslB (radical SAM superfamily)
MSIRVRKYQSPKFCGYPSTNPEYFEIRWEFIDCILGCDYCGKTESKSKKFNIIELSPTQIFHNTIKKIKKPSKSFISFSGGEPTLHWNKLLQVFKKLSNIEFMANVPILIQTNGVSIGMGTTNLHDLNSPPLNELKILFELLIKGTNSEEFELLTRTSKKLYPHQLTAYKMLKNIQKHNPNIAFVSVLGNYHSSVKSKLSKYAFVYPTDQKLMFDGYRPWDKEFEKIWNENKRKWVEPLREYPKGQWENALQICGPEGTGLIKYFPEGVITNPQSLFAPKPRGYDYAKKIVNKAFW